MRESSIAAKLTWTTMLVTTAALLLSSAAFAIYLIFSFRQTLVRGLAVQSRIVGFNSASALLFDDPHSAQSTMAALSAAPHILSAQIFTGDGKLFAEYVNGENPPPAARLSLASGETEYHQFLHDSLLLVHRVDFRGKTLGTVQIRSDLAEIHGLEIQYALITIMILAGCLTAAFVISQFVQRSVAQPIVQLAQTAQAVSRDKNFSIRVDTAERRDELGILMTSFNEMLAEIQQRDSELQKVHDELERRVKDRTARLEAANKELEAFSYSVSHDLRAPLRQISGFAKILADDAGPRLDDSAQRYLRLVQEGARKMGELIDDLINMGRISRLKPTFRTAELSLLVQSVLSEMEPQLAGRSIDWRIGPLPSVECDPGLIRLLLANLLSNAVKYTKYRDRPVIEVSSTTLDGETVISVRDNGAGFDPKYSDKLFGVFQRLHTAEEFEGTGIGLATAKRIVQKHGGRIWAEGEPGVGAAFFVALKRAQAEERSIPAPISKSPG